MRLFRIIIFTSIISTLVLPGMQAVAKPNLETQEPYRGSSICTPGSDLVDNCVLNGPAKVQLDWQEKGLSYPLLGLPAYTPDASYNELPYRYAAILADPKREVRLFPSLDDAVAAENQSGSIPAGALRWVAFTAQADVNGGHYVQLPDSFEWVRASPAEVVNFQGLAFYRTPDLEFGWLGDHTTSRTAPSLESPSTGTRYYRNSVVQIFGTERGNEEDWIQIGINEWVESRYVKRVRINTNPPEGVTNNRWIEVNLYDQTLAVYDNRQLVYATMIAIRVGSFLHQTGIIPDPEKTGYGKNDRGI